MLFFATLNSKNRNENAKRVIYCFLLLFDKKKLLGKYWWKNNRTSGERNKKNLMEILGKNFLNLSLTKINTLKQKINKIIRKWHHSQSHKNFRFLSLCRNFYDSNFFYIPSSLNITSIILPRSSPLWKSRIKKVEQGRRGEYSSYQLISELTFVDAILLQLPHELIFTAIK